MKRIFFIYTHILNDKEIEYAHAYTYAHKIYGFSSQIDDCCAVQSRSFFGHSMSISLSLSLWMLFVSQCWKFALLSFWFCSQIAFLSISSCFVSISFFFHSATDENRSAWKVKWHTNIYIDIEPLHWHWCRRIVKRNKYVWWCYCWFVIMAISWKIVVDSFVFFFRITFSRR